MPRRLFRFDEPERFVAGTVGQPGERVFYLQASDGQRRTSVALEKTQVALLAERLTALLAEATRRGGDVPTRPSGPADNAALDSPVEEEFRVGAMVLAWDGEDARVVIEVQAQTGADEPDVEPLTDADEGPDTLRVRLSAGQARGFVARAERVVGAGRKPCPLCSLPLDPSGHLCPRHNGYRS